MEEIEYVYGKNRYGKIKAVMVPIDLWEKIKAMFLILLSLEGYIMVYFSSRKIKKILKGN